MKDIFAEFYNKVIGFFRRTEEIEERSKDVARNRLRVVLMQDRTNLTPELLERMRKELVELLSKYVEMDKEALELNLEHEGDQMALMLSIPVVRAKEEAEIAAAEQKEEAADEETDDDTEDITEEEDSKAEETGVSEKPAEEETSNDVAGEVEEETTEPEVDEPKEENTKQPKKKKD